MELKREIIAFEDICFSFEQVYKDEEAKRIFTTFVAKVCRSGELLDFYNAVLVFQLIASPEERAVAALEIYNKYISANSFTQINIGEEVASIIRNRIENANSKERCSEILPSIFDDALLYTLRLLHHDIFPRFVRSSVWIDFLKAKSISFIKKVGNTETFAATQHYTTNFAESKITEEDFKFLQIMELDTVNWRPLLTSNSHSQEVESTVYISKTSYSIESKNKSRKTFKVSGILQNNIEEVLNTLVNPEFRKNIELNLLSVIEPLDFIPKSDETQYSVAVTHEQYPSPYPLQNRDFVVASTLRYDEKQQCYMLLKKSTAHPNMPEREGTVRAHCIGGWILQKIGSQKTRYVFIQYLDMNPTEESEDTTNNILWNLIIKSKLRDFHNQLKHVLKQSSFLSYKKPSDSLGLLETLYSTQYQPMSQQEVQTTPKSKKDLRRIVYLSFHSRKLSEQELKEIAEKSVLNNKRDNLTGMLLATLSTFYQVIEGESSQLQITFDRIVKDPRHKQVIVLKDEHFQYEFERQFPYWSMNCLNLDEKDLQNQDPQLVNMTKQFISSMCSLKQDDLDSFASDKLLNTILPQMMHEKLETAEAKLNKKRFSSQLVWINELDSTSKHEEIKKPILMKEWQKLQKGSTSVNCCCVC